MESAEGTTYYLRGVFHKKDSTNYCGYTWNGSAWFKGPYTTNDGWKSFPPVIISSSSATIELSAKIDSDDSGCKESGHYQFKVQRFTEGGSGSFDDQNEQDVGITVPSPTLAATPTPVVKPPTATPQSTSKVTNSPTEKKALPSPTVQNATIILTKNVTETTVPEASTTVAATSGDVLGEAENPSEPSKESTIAGVSSKPLSFIFFGIGAVFIALSLFLLSKKRKKLKGSEDFLA